MNSATRAKITTGDVDLSVCNFDQLSSPSSNPAAWYVIIPYHFLIPLPCLTSLQEGLLISSANFEYSSNVKSHCNCRRIKTKHNLKDFHFAFSHFPQRGCQNKNVLYGIPTLKGVGCLSVGVKFWLIWLIEGGGCTQMRETRSPEINHHKLKKQIMLLNGSSKI